MIQKSMLHSSLLNKETYWKHSVGERSFEEVEFSIEASVSRRLNEWPAQESYSVDTVIHAVWSLLLSRYEDAEEVSFESLVWGPAFPNPIAMHISVNESATFGTLLHMIQDQFRQASVQGSGMADTERTLERSPCDFHIVTTAVQEQWMIKLLYDASVYEQSVVQRIAGHFGVVLEAVAGNPDTDLSGIDILTADERRQLNGYNQAVFEFDKERSIHHLFEEQAALRPDEVAITCDGIRLTYDEVNRNANRIAHWLIGRGVGSEQLVAILMHRQPRMAECILAVWKAGAAYVPLDPAYPPERIKSIVADSGCVMVLTDSGILESLGSPATELACPAANLDELQAELYGCSEHNPNVHIDLHQLSYVIYTSGSTGKPKGAMVEHIGMMNHLYAKINDLRITPDSVVVQNASHCFDISVWQFFAALAAGGTTAIYPNDLAADPDSLIDAVIEDEVTVLEVVPSYLSVMLEFLESDFREFPDLEVLVVTGEALKRNVVKRWFDLYPSIPVVNAYGPTECSDDITHHIMHEVPELDTIPVGKPVHNFHIYIVDKQMRLCPPGVKGEICVSGIGVGRGYLNDPSRTEAVFMNDPFSEQPNRRLYKTGDLGRWLPDGTIEFFGRKDHQVKIRGFRVELGEIENKLVEHPDVNEAIVLDLEDEIGAKYLCAYIVGRIGLDPASVKAHVTQLLPYYMVPAQIIQLAKMPVTPNGKVDRKALSKPGSVLELV
ncbi:amino acid adenylation domain-containing protein [Paenibacillus chartarius]|uniref:Amino acid adenylation domain-containing protein n=1 Tax=Paenibacillus chartarius TaxID=747481 RepID=A0ABV6DTC7_9BACL